MRILPGFIFLVYLLVSFAHEATAQAVRPPTANGPHNETPVAPGLQGIWSSPDCTAAQEAYIIAPHYAMLYRPGGLYSLGAVQSWRQEDDDGDTLYQFRTNLRSNGLIKKTNDGLMKIQSVDVNPKAPLKSAWGGIEDRTAREFAHCAKLFDSGAGFGQDEVNAVFLLDTAFKGCKDVVPGDFNTAKSCHQALFDLADSNKNKSLDHIELARIYRQVAFVLSASSYCGGISYPDNSVAEGEDFAAGILETEKNITFDQLMVRITTPGFLKGRIQTFADNIRNTQSMLPFMPESDAPKGCKMVEPENMKNLGTVTLPETNTLKDPASELETIEPKTTRPAPLPVQAR